MYFVKGLGWMGLTALSALGVVLGVVVTGVGFATLIVGIGVPLVAAGMAMTAGCAISTVKCAEHTGHNFSRSFSSSHRNDMVYHGRNDNTRERKAELHEQVEVMRAQNQTNRPAMRNKHSTMLAESIDDKFFGGSVDEDGNKRKFYAKFFGGGKNRSEMEVSSMSMGAGMGG